MTDKLKIILILITPSPFSKRKFSRRMKFLGKILQYILCPKPWLHYHMYFSLHNSRSQRSQKLLYSCKQWKCIHQHIDSCSLSRALLESCNNSSYKYFNDFYSENCSPNSRTHVYLQLVILLTTETTSDFDHLGHQYNLCIASTVNSGHKQQ